MEWLYYLLATMFVMGLILLSLNIYVAFDYAMNEHEHQLIIEIFISQLRLLKKQHDMTQILAMSQHSRLDYRISRHLNQLPQLLKGMLKLTKDLLQRLTFHQFSWQTTIGTGEASSTGILVGGLWSIKSILMGFLMQYCQFKCQPQTDLAPQFQRKEMSTKLNCMVSIRLGKAIFMLIRSMWYLFKLISKRK